MYILRLLYLRYRQVIVRFSMTYKFSNQTKVNDVHSEMNTTIVKEVIKVSSAKEIQDLIMQASETGIGIAICGGRHAMGGQQFLTDSIVVDMSGLNQVYELNYQTGQITVGAGIQWPELIKQYHLLQHERGIKWGIAQKQTGADRLSIGGAIASNIHGRGLNMKPFCQDIVNFTIVNPQGQIQTCSIDQNASVFRRVIGGYGLFGIVTKVTLQLVERSQVERIVQPMALPELLAKFESCQREGYLYGDFQFAIDPDSDDFLHNGIFSGYKPIDTTTPIPKSKNRLSKQNWQDLLLLAHTQKSKAFETFKAFYLRSSGQRYWSDTHQLTIYLDDYHKQLDEKMGCKCKGSEIITELYVPKTKLTDFMNASKKLLRTMGANIIYGTVRIIQKDDISSMPWAKEDFACIIFNVHTDHDKSGIEKSRRILVALIDVAIEQQGSYFPTYHRFARKEQVLACFPDFIHFMQAKKSFDPKQIFSSDWYRHYTDMFDEELATVHSENCFKK
jgi:FAD/FMN-containing dehydrogenase